MNQVVGALRFKGNDYLRMIKQIIWFPSFRNNHAHRLLLQRLIDLRDDGRCWLWGDEIDGRACYVITPLDENGEPLEQTL